MVLNVTFDLERTKDTMCSSVGYSMERDGLQDTDYMCKVQSTSSGWMVLLFRGDHTGDEFNCGSFMLLPGENMWAKPWRAAIYLVALLYCFLGIAIVADTFMNAIETITSKEVEVLKTNPATGKKEIGKVKYWNGTVANLTLMALGSSAPEILLSLLGIIPPEQEADQLGPSAIVGSAAFNLLVIGSVCIVAPVPEFRKIASYGVFQVSAFFSVWAYVWLLIIVDFISPEVIELWEALVTLLHFPVLVFLSYAQDVNWAFLKGGAVSPCDEEDKRDNRMTFEYRMAAIRYISAGPRLILGHGPATDHGPEMEAEPEFDADGKSTDPYIKVSALATTQKTSWKRKSLNPTWNETLTFPLKASQQAMEKIEVLLELVDHDDLSTDDFIAKCKVDVPKDSKDLDLWLALSPDGLSGDTNQKGLLHLTATFGTELVIKVKEGKNLPGTERANEQMDALAACLGNQKRRYVAKYRYYKELIGTAYYNQFATALTVNGEVDEDGNELPPSTGDLIMHFVTVFWKVLFSTIPPSEWKGGWAAFLVALTQIGVVTAIVGELANLFGCSVGLKQATTGITFVALGTSLPDMFASKIAAVQEETADNAIGNVTGSNGVNVFLGIGLPWVILATVWEIDGKHFFCRDQGGFGLMVMLFIIAALIFIGLLCIRRTTGGELGGPAGPANAAAGVGVTLWMVYIVLSGMRQYDDIGDVWTIHSDAPGPPPPSGAWIEGFVGK